MWKLFCLLLLRWPNDGDEGQFDGQSSSWCIHLSIQHFGTELEFLTTTGQIDIKFDYGRYIQFFTS